MDPGVRAFVSIGELRYVLVSVALTGCSAVVLRFQTITVTGKRKSYENGERRGTREFT